jgi:peptide/nickel transport system permease protein
MMLDQNENSEPVGDYQKEYGFDQPISVQYLNYLKRPLTDFTSWNY